MGRWSLHLAAPGLGSCSLEAIPGSGGNTGVPRKPGGGWLRARCCADGGGTALRSCRDLGPANVLGGEAAWGRGGGEICRGRQWVAERRHSLAGHRRGLLGIRRIYPRKLR